MTLDGDGASELICYSFSTDPPYVSCYEVVGSERSLGDIVNHMSTISEDEKAFVMDHVLVLWRPYYLFYAIGNWAYCASDMYFELRMGRSGRSVFLGWHDVESFVLSLRNVAMSTLDAQCGSLYKSAVGCYPIHRLLYFCINHPLSWRAGPGHSIFDIWQLRDIAFYPLWVSPS